MLPGFDVHLVDGTYELFRHHFGAPPAKGASGREAGAVRGWVRSLVALLAERETTHVAVAFDHVIESFRNELYDGYKTGEGLPEELVAQFEPAEEATRALGVVVWPMVRFEADDALATAAARWRGARGVRRVVLCSPDKDLAQCVRDERVILRDRRRKADMGEEGVVEKFGVRPASIPDYLALVGDAADGIPGLPGWGARSAAAVLSRFEKLETVPLDAGKWEPRPRSAERLARTLEERWDDAILYRTLATLREDVPLEESLEDLRWHSPDASSLAAWEAELRIPGLVDRARSVAGDPAGVPGRR